MKPDSANVKPSPQQPSTDFVVNMKYIVWEKLDEARELGEYDDASLCRRIGQLLKMDIGRVIEYKQEYEKTIVSQRKQAAKFQEQDLDYQKKKVTKFTENCPMCSIIRDELNRKQAEWDEQKRELRADLNQHKEALRQAETDKRKLEFEILAQKTANASLQVRVDNIRNTPATVAPADPEMAEIKKQIWAKGVEAMGAPKTDAQAVADTIMKQAPQIITGIKDIIHEANTDKTGENIYPQAKVQKKYRGPKPQSLGNQNRPAAAKPISQAVGQKAPAKAPAPQPASNPPQDGNTLNRLGQAFYKRHPNIDAQDIKLVTDHIMKVYSKVGPDVMVKKTNDTFRLLARLRQIGGYIRRIKNHEIFPVINKELTSNDAAEWIWKEEPDLANDLATRGYDEIIGLLIPFQHHPIYHVDYEFLTQPDVAQIVDEILAGLNIRYRAEMQQKSQRPLEEVDEPI